MNVREFSAVPIIFDYNVYRCSRHLIMGPFCFEERELEFLMGHLRRYCSCWYSSRKSSLYKAQQIKFVQD